LLSTLYWERHIPRAPVKFLRLPPNSSGIIQFDTSNGTGSSGSNHFFAAFRLSQNATAGASECGRVRRRKAVLALRTSILDARIWKARYTCAIVESFPGPQDRRRPRIGLPRRAATGFAGPPLRYGPLAVAASIWSMPAVRLPADFRSLYRSTR
jgi:hypothetical protein